MPLVGSWIRVSFLDPNEPNLAPVELETEPETGRLEIRENGIEQLIVQAYREALGEAGLVVADLPDGSLRVTR